jgi:DNA-binding CsgD family transcriptional regulator
MKEPTKENLKRLLRRRALVIQPDNDGGEYPPPKPDKNPIKTQEPSGKTKVQLSDRERAVLVLISEGLTMPEIARRLSRSTRLIGSDIKTLRDRVGAKSLAELVEAAKSLLND